MSLGHRTSSSSRFPDLCICSFVLKLLHHVGYGRLQASMTACYAITNFPFFFTPFQCSTARTQARIEWCNWKMHWILKQNEEKEGVSRTARWVYQTTVNSDGRNGWMLNRSCHQPTSNRGLMRASQHNYSGKWCLCLRFGFVIDPLWRP